MTDDEKSNEMLICIAMLSKMLSQIKFDNLSEQSALELGKAINHLVSSGIFIFMELFKGRDCTPVQCDGKNLINDFYNPVIGLIEKINSKNKYVQ